MKTTQEMISIMQAYADGKEIEVFNGSTWHHTIDPTWNWWTRDYRVKETPEYVPFSFEDEEFLIGKVVKHKRDNWVVAITYYYKNETQIGTFEDLLRNFTFLDGSPCGKLKQ